MTMSIVHRITGCANYFGMALLAWWLIAAVSGPEAFATAQWFLGSWIGLLLMFGYTWSVLHHMIGGVRHLVWDTGRGLNRQSANMIAWLTLAASILLTLAVWVIGFALRG